jgi:hypothetical protein
MIKPMMIVFLAAFIALTGCTDTDHYPITGDACGPSDPVQELDASECVPLI